MYFFYIQLLFLKLFLGMVGNKSVYKTAQYERVTQDPDDNEEEDDILYKQENGVQV